MKQLECPSPRARTLFLCLFQNAVAGASGVALPTPPYAPGGTGRNRLVPVGCTGEIANV